MSITTARQSAEGRSTIVIAVTPTVSTTPAYSAGDNVGGKITLSGAERFAAGSGILQSVTVVDTSNQKAPLELLIFDSDPAAATITDNAAYAPSTVSPTLLAHVSIAAADYVTVAAEAYAVKAGLGIALEAAAGTSLYAVLVTSGTPTYASTTALTLHVGIVQD